MTGLGLEGALRCRQCILQAAKSSQRRTFTSTPSRQKHGALPTFTPTSSAELDTILSTFRSKVFLPSHLLKRHRDLVFRKRNHPVLTSEPVTVTIGDEEIQLEPIDHIADVPNIRKELGHLLRVMKEPSDWDNLPAFLEGLFLAKRKLDGGLVDKMVRMASEMGRQGVVMECVRRAGTTGLVLNDAKHLRQVMWGARLRALQAGWSEEGMDKALLQAEQIMELLEDPKHSSKLGVVGEHPRTLPEVNGVVLELAAVKAVKYANSKDEDRKVATYATTTLASIQTHGNFDFNSDDWHDANYKLQMWAPVLHGLRLAFGVLKENTTLAQDIRNTTRELGEVVSQTRTIVLANTPQDGTRRGLKVYDDIASSQHAS
ncbi:MAG: hypothetical protein M1830_006211 [Pleopsidium flavum]|nr:MAG: hypothetical protein M1830_006211 [Pleopsidium flavum]